ncbi:MlaA family lipoprotein [Zavarzinia sp. CC-PAN008]|uniref:MlaA family lipoprotein n=1 Tax=Zavarzinia sp. CC-PAN008 TaxID=3243332 RepID=UPI003F745B0B
MPSAVQPLPRLAAVAVAAALLLAACATPPDPADPDAVAEYEQANDPLEPLNRATFDFNLFVDRVLLKPVAWVYREVVPEQGRQRVTNFLDNTEEPLSIVNAVLQGNLDGAGATTVRFLTNSTLGIGGLFDVATDWGLPRAKEDFGQTLGTYGVAEGPYIMLPLLGPSNPRDLTGFVADQGLDPLSYFYWTNHRNDISTYVTAAKLVDARARRYQEAADLEASSLDLYATVRSLYRQRRTQQIEDQAAWPSADDSTAPQAASPEATDPDQAAADSDPANALRPHDVVAWTDGQDYAVEGVFTGKGPDDWFRPDEEMYRVRNLADGQVRVVRLTELRLVSRR